jgi:hypothetical protein
MADAPQMDRPGVEVIQQFASVAPTILRPSLSGCVVGPCKQVIEAVTDEGTLNSESLVTTPARFTSPWLGTPFQFAGIGGKTLALSVNNGPAIPVTMPVTNPTVAQVVDAVRTAAIAGLSAKVETSGSQQRLVLETTSKGDNAALVVAAATHVDVRTAFGLLAGQTARGQSGYDNAGVLRVQLADYPDPRGNAKNLKIDYASVRAFVNGGAGAREISRTEAFLQGAQSAVTIQDDGDGDSLSPYYSFAGAAFSASPARASASGTSDLSAVDYATAVQGKLLKMSINGEPFQTLVFPNTVTDSATLITAINGLWGTGTAAVVSTHLVLGMDGGFGGAESSIRIDKDVSTPGLLTALGLTGVGAPFNATSVVRGTPYPPQVGDEVWIDGIRIGLIVEVVASPTNRLRLDTEQLLNFTGSSWYILAKGLDNSQATAQRPSSDLTIDENTGTLVVKAGLFHDTAGSGTSARGLPVYLAYDALRLDVTPAKVGGDFSLLRIGLLSDLEAKLSPVDTQNPLAMGMYFAMLNATGLELTGCGIDETNAATPEGTADAYARAFEFIESKEIYAIAPMTHSSEVGQIAQTHVDVLSSPTNGLERIAILNPLRPSRKSNTLIASGARANVSGPPSDVVQTGIANLQALLAAAGKPGPAFTEEDDVFIEFEGDPHHYLIQSVSSGAVTVNNGPLAGNEDGFYLEGGGSAVFEEIVVDRPFTIALRGKPVANLTEEAAAYGDIGRGYKDRRVICIVPDQCKATLDGLETILPGYYMAAALAGLKSSKSPSQPLTESTLAGFTGVVGSSDRYSEVQLRIIDGGGMWVMYQDADDQPIRVRHQLTTDTTSLLTRESSIVDALDYASKTIRSTYRNFIGRFNITTSLLEALNLVNDGIRDFFISNGIFADFSVVEMQQVANTPDEIDLICDITTLKPFNKLRVTLRAT